MQITDTQASTANKSSTDMGKKLTSVTSENMKLVWQLTCLMGYYLFVTSNIPFATIMSSGYSNFSGYLKLGVWRILLHAGIVFKSSINMTSVTTCWHVQTSFATKKIIRNNSEHFCFLNQRNKGESTQNDSTQFAGLHRPRTINYKCPVTVLFYHHYHF